ncbi:MULTISPECIES: four helix bundle protein [unclassified Brevundimonas]|jgi:four helix bundle protein|uniref:four helix bundle protein n=1 Tax=unclassified Brevundimonas TaxID=2622653 RepID=UPI000C3A946C|nr:MULTISPECIES: four helix bundle protein [unclassified Brevundimonas]MAL88761.1 diversity-generating retroelement protein bAvd family protein [Brevundimonas sp.]|tara:strand:+ start:14785 stop:15159 length:375 start_codon:yes stop_codon:yes gene_type:complete
MDQINSYRDLKVWQRAMDMAQSIYELTRSYPGEERFGLTAQTRRAATSVPANIAEGYGRSSKGAYLNFLRIAQGSLKETETHLLIAVRVGLATEAAAADALRQADELGKMLRGLIIRLEAHAPD